ncbi:MAG: FUSC family protein [Cyanobacteriota bacterium]
MRTATALRAGEPLRLSLQIPLAALVAYLAGAWFTALFPGYLPKTGGLLSAISAILVTQLNRRDTTASASLRLLGSAIGALSSALYLTVLPFQPLGMAAVIFVTVLLCLVLNIPGHARLAAITVIVVMVSASLDPRLNPVVNALLRLAESGIGTLVAVLTVLLWPENHPSESSPSTNP